MCRQKVLASGMMQVDNASSSVIGHTQLNRQKFVRLYFRPLTPTQYYNEGIRPLNQRVYDAHCPVPVFFLFDAFTIFSRDDSLFSEGNIGRSQVSISATKDFFQKIPFEHVFHDGYFSAEMRDEIVFRRNAEILIPNSLSLESVPNSIVCRSSAERQTLLHLLSPKSRLKWNKKIQIDTSQGLFERKWSFVEEVIATDVDHTLRFRFNPNSQATEPFDIKLDYTENGIANTKTWKAKKSLKQSLSISIPGAKIGVAKLQLDDSLAFQGIVRFNNIPI